MAPSLPSQPGQPSDPSQPTEPSEPSEPSDPASLVVALACLTYTDLDEPARWARAGAVLADHPHLVDEDVAVAAVVGEAEALTALLAADSDAATRPAGPQGWPPLLHLVYSRLPQRDPVGSARLLLDAGADPDTGFVWPGQPTPFTALTGVFGEGEMGRARQPRHPVWRELAELLIDRGADPNDRQALYNRMFNRDDSHLELLLDHGLGHPASEVWTRRLGSTGETVAQMVERQLRWADQHGFTARLELLAVYGFTPHVAPVRSSADRAAALPVVHRAATPEAVRRVAADGADLDARHVGRTALHEAAFRGDEGLVVALLEAGADPAVRDDTHGATPEGWAEWARHDAVARLLRDRRG